MSSVLDSFAKQLMEATIHCNASPVCLKPAPSAGGSCSSLNSSNTDNANMQPEQVGADVAPATAEGESKLTVTVGQHPIEITADCSELVRVAKLVLDNYFSSSEFLASMEARAAFDGTSLLSPVTTPSTPLPGAGIGLNYFPNNNGEGDVEVFAEPSNGAATSNQNGLARSRRSHFSRREPTAEEKAIAEKLKLEEEKASKANAPCISYDPELMIYYSQSPHACVLPPDWENIKENVPSILRYKPSQL